jgi:hypothetical protein
VAPALPRWVTRNSVSSVADSVTHGEVEKCVPAAWVTVVTDESVPAAACA